MRTINIFIGMTIIVNILCASASEAITKRPSQSSPINSSSGASQVKMIDANNVRPFCIAVKNSTLRQDYNWINSIANKVGATHAVMGRTTYDNKAEVTFYQCSPLVNMDTAEVKRRCDQSDSYACIEMAYRVDAAKYLQRSCTLKNDIGCKMLVQYKQKQERDRNWNAAVKSCNSGNMRSCLALASGYHQAGDLTSAIKMAEYACVHGSQEGCMLHGNLLKKQASEDAQIFQMVNASMMMLQNDSRDYEQQLRDIYNAPSQPQNDKPYKCKSQINPLGTGVITTNCESR